MDPHLLRTFTEVARLGSFSAAARELGHTHSAVSQHIPALGADLGVELLGRRPVAPTEAGARLLDHAGPLLTRSVAGARGVPVVEPRLVHRVEAVTRPEPDAVARLFTGSLDTESSTGADTGPGGGAGAGRRAPAR